MAAADKKLETTFKSISKEGWLEKQSRHLKRWKKRWCVLQESTLYSFKKERSYISPTEVIDLRVFSSVKSSEELTNRPHSFDVYSSDMVFSMVASTEAEKEDWIRAIGRAIVISRTKSWQDENDSEDAFSATPARPQSQNKPAAAKSTASDAQSSQTTPKK